MRQFFLGWFFANLVFSSVPLLAQDASSKPLADLPVKTVELTSPIDNLTLGANGKYLFLHLKQEQKLAALNVATGAIDKLLPLAESDILFTANAEKLFILLRESKVLQRWNIKTWEREQSQPLQDYEQILHLVTGHGAQGPLLLGI